MDSSLLSVACTSFSSHAFQHSLNKEYTKSQQKHTCTCLKDQVTLKRSAAPPERQRLVGLHNVFQANQSYVQDPVSENSSTTKKPKQTKLSVIVYLIPMKFSDFYIQMTSSNKRGSKVSLAIRGSHTKNINKKYTTKSLRKHIKQSKLHTGVEQIA